MQASAESVSPSGLLQEKATLDIVTENMREGAILLDASLGVLFVNPAARRMLNIGKEEQNSGAILHAFVTKFKVTDIKQNIEEAQPGNPYHIDEVEADNDIFQVFISRFSEEDEKKYHAHALIWIEDITEAKMLERRKSEFVSVVAHQLRTPLSGLKWTLHMLINGDLGQLTDDQKTFLMKSYENNDRMIALVNDMLAADRIESGRTKYSLMRIDLCDLLENVLFEVFPNAQKRGVKIDFVRSEKKFMVLVDPSKIRAVLQNLLENGIKYTMKGGVVSIKLESEAENAKVMISDTGIGIPKAQQGQIFSRFFRADNASVMEPSGTGLGLYMVKKIVEQHGGKAWFISEEGKGSTFFLSLPEIQPNDGYKQI